MSQEGASRSQLSAAPDANTPAGVGTPVTSLNVVRSIRRVLGIKDVSEVFHLPCPEAAAVLGVGISTLKKVCRRLGIARWPYRQLKTEYHILERMAQSENADLASASVSSTAGSRMDTSQKRTTEASDPLRVKIPTSTSFSVSSLTPSDLTPSDSFWGSPADPDQPYVSPAGDVSGGDGGYGGFVCVGGGHGSPYSPLCDDAFQAWRHTALSTPPAMPDPNAQERYRYEPYTHAASDVMAIEGYEGASNQSLGHTESPRWKYQSQTVSVNSVPCLCAYATLPHMMAECCNMSHNLSSSIERRHPD